VNSDTNTGETQALIEQLGLLPHIEGGYFRRSFQSDHRVGVDTPAGERLTLTSIYYLLTVDSPVGHWHRNQSDIVHYFHLGSPLHYYLLHENGRLETRVMGPDLAAGQVLQLAVRGGTWKASHLPAGEHGLVSEAVAPGFDPADMTLGDRVTLRAQFPEHGELIERFTRA
jgi:predicted cupin superfamily sugar epimerase